MTKIKLNWKYAHGELDTDTLNLVCIPARGKRAFGPDEVDAELCIKDGMNFQIADIHMGDAQSSNILCAEIVRRWNEFEDWHSVEKCTPEVGKDGCSDYVLITDGSCIPIVAKYTDSSYTRKYTYLGKDGKRHECHWFDTYFGPVLQDITHWKAIKQPQIQNNEL